MSSASATLTADARTASVSPDLSCISRTISTIDAQRRLFGMNHHVHAGTEHVELGIGHQRGDLDQDVLLKIKTGHLAVDPDEVIVHAATLRRLQRSVSTLDPGRPGSGAVHTPLDGSRPADRRDIPLGRVCVRIPVEGALA